MTIITASPRLLTRLELAEATGISGSFIDKLRRQGLPVIKTGRCARFDLEDCIQWLKRNSQGAGK